MDAVPGIVVWSGGNTTTDEDNLGLHEHLLARGKNGTIGDNEVFDDLWVGNNDKELVTQPHGVQGAELLGPFV